MKTTVLNVISSNPFIKSGVIRLTENNMGNYSVEGLSSNLPQKVKACVLSAIDFCLVGYEDPMNQQNDLHVTVI
jgi:hypothetical protein